AYGTDEDVALTVPAATGGLANDTNTDGGPITAALVGGPAHGRVTLNPDGSFTYTPAAGYAGADSFTYQATDGTYSSRPATVSLTVRNLLPVVTITSGPTEAVAGEPITFTATATDSPEDTLTYSWF